MLFLFSYGNDGMNQHENHKNENNKYQIKGVKMTENLLKLRKKGRERKVRSVW